MYPGDTAQFNCEVIGNPEPTVTWEYNGRLISQSKESSYDEHFLFSDVESEHSLQMYNVNQTDGGMLCATSANEMGQAKVCAQLSVLEALPESPTKESVSLIEVSPEEQMEGAAPHFHIEIQTSEVSPGDVATFEGQVVSEPPLENLSWLKDGVVLDEKATCSTGELKYFFEYRSADGYCALIIVEVEDADEGLYAVAAKNALGFAQSEASLVLSGNLQ